MKENLKKCKKNLILISLIIFLNNINLYNVVAILYYKSITNSFVLGMSIFSIVTISSAIFELPTGILSDKIGRKKTIVYGSVCSLLSAFILFIANNYFLLIIYAIISGIEFAFFSGNNDAYVYENLKMINNEKDYIKFIGKVKSMGYLAAALSGFIGAILLYFFSYKFIIGISIVPKAIQLILSLFLGVINIVKVNNKKKTEIITNVWPTWAIGIPGILANIGAFISNWFSEKIIRIISRKKYWLFSHFYSIMSNITAVIINNAISPIILVSNSIFHNDFINSEIEQRLYKDEYRASMGSIKNFIQSMLFSAFSIVLGLVADYFSIVTSFIIFQLLNIIPIIAHSKIIEDVEKN